MLILNDSSCWSATIMPPSIHKFSSDCRNWAKNKDLKQILIAQHIIIIYEFLHCILKAHKSFHKLGISLHKEAVCQVKKISLIRSCQI